MMTGFGVLLRKEVREQWRTMRLPIVGAIFLVFGLLSPLTARFMPEILQRFAADIEIRLPTPSAGDAVDQLVKNIGQMGPVAAILLAMSMVAREKEQGTAALVLTKPATRGAFLLSKFIALLVTLAAAIGLAGIGAYLYTAILFEMLPAGGFVIACLLLLLALLVFAALTFLGSTMLRSALPAAAIGLAALFATGLLAIVPSVNRVMPGGLYAPARALALGIRPEHLWLPLFANSAAIVALLALAWLSFRRQEL
jgi:ABC-2 type transport system permease protein